MEDTRRSIIIAGAGYLGTRAAAVFAEAGYRSFAVRRTRLAGTPGGGAPAVTYLAGDASAPETWWPHDAVGILAITLPPTARDYPRLLERLTHAAGERGVNQIIFSSSTGVYREHNGGIVDEEAPLDRASPRGAALVDAEERVRRSTGMRVAVLRFSGIYGPGRSPWHRYLPGPEPLPREFSDTWTNRIHVEDAARAMLFVADKQLCGTFNVTDDLPATVAEIGAWIAGQGAATPSARRSGFPGEVQGPVAARRGVLRGGSKRVTARRLRSLGWNLAVPNFQAGWEREHLSAPGP